MRERIQKLLAARGVGSRRQVEAWIVAGRITVNSKLATPGQPVDERDDVRLDGRRLRLSRGADQPHSGLIYHRPAQEDVRAGGDTGSPGSIERLPRSAGRRWISISPLAANDGGLELFVTDGALAAALTRPGLSIPSEYSVRVRGVYDDATIGETLIAGVSRLGLKGQITSVAAAGGEGSNRWLQIAAIGMRPRDLKQLFDHCGLEANRILRTRYGPIAMDRSLARGRSRALTDEELVSLQEATGKAPVVAPRPPRPPRRRAPTTGSRKPRR